MDIEHPVAPPYRDRLAYCLSLLCGERPPMDLVDRWVAYEPEATPDATNLLDWVASRAPAAWLSRIAVIEAAEGLAGKIGADWVEPEEKR